MAGKLIAEMHSWFVTISIKTQYLYFPNTGLGFIRVFLVKPCMKLSIIKCITSFLHHSQSYGIQFTISNTQKNNYWQYRNFI